MVSALAVVTAALSVLAGTARSAPGLLIGVDDDTLKWTEDTAQVFAAHKDAGFGSVRVTLQWRPGQTIADDDGRTYLRRAQNAAFLGERIVLAVYGPASSPPTTPDAQAQYCSYVVDSLSRSRRIRDVVIWNEVNSALFWKPQQGSAAAYESLLATCYDAIHRFRKNINVISSTSPHESPGAFIAQMGAAYKASGRTLPIFDTYGHDAYPEVSTESPLSSHVGTLSLDEGDYLRLVQALTAAFGNTGQPVPGAGNVPSGGFAPSGAVMSSATGFITGTTLGGPVTIWYLEDGFETVVPTTKRAAYTGRESNRQLVQPVAVRRTAATAPDQASQFRDALALAFCQPAVGAFFNFELQDEVGLGGWQSGFLWADGTPKPSYRAAKDTIATVAAGQVDCSRFAASTGAQLAPVTTTATAP